jgi:hypothetical protein
MRTRSCASAAANAPTACPAGDDSACTAGAALPATTSAANIGDSAIVTGIAHIASWPKCITVTGAVALQAATDALVAGIALRTSTCASPSPLQQLIMTRSRGRDTRMSPTTAAKLSWKPGFAACGASATTMAIAAIDTTASPEQRSPDRRTAPTPAAINAARTAETSVWIEAANTAARPTSAAPSMHGMRRRARGTSATAASTPMLKPEMATRC